MPWIALFPASALPQVFAQSEGPWVGLLQQPMVGAIAAWIVVVALRVRTIAASATTAEPRQHYSGSPQRI